MNNGWIDISECTEGYYLFDCEGVNNIQPVLVDNSGQVRAAGVSCSNALYIFKGKALKLADINNNGDVLVQSKL